MEVTIGSQPAKYLSSMTLSVCTSSRARRRASAIRGSSSVGRGTDDKGSGGASRSTARSHARADVAASAYVGASLGGESNAVEHRCAELPLLRARNPA